MPITEDLDIYFADFGVDATFGSITGKVLFDSPEGIFAEADRVTAENEITYKKDLFPGLINGSAITVDGVNYTVNTPFAVEDGKLMKATLSTA